MKQKNLIFSTKMKSCRPDTYLSEESPQKIEINPECFRRRDGYLEF